MYDGAAVTTKQTKKDLHVTLCLTCRAGGCEEALQQSNFEGR
jgi:hypothetical protein